jgi:hypothetical protein
MEIGRTIKESFSVVKDNVSIIVPPIAASFLTYVFAMLLVGSMIAGAVTGTKVISPLGIMIFIFISFLFHSVSQAITISMAEQTLSEGRCSLKRGLDIAVSRVSSVLAAGIILGILSTVGMMLFILPGLLVAYFFMFTFVIVVLEEAGSIEALKESFRVVKTNLTDSLRVFLSIAGIGLLLWIVSRIFMVVPLLGGIINAILMGGFLSFVSVVLVKTYRELQE